MVRFITGRMQEEKIKKQPPETAAYHSKGTRYRAFTEYTYDWWNKIGRSNNG